MQYTLSICAGGAVVELELRSNSTILWPPSRAVAAPHDSGSSGTSRLHGRETAYPLNVYWFHFPPLIFPLDLLILFAASVFLNQSLTDFLPPGCWMSVTLAAPTNSSNYLQGVGLKAWDRLNPSHHHRHPLPPLAPSWQRWHTQTDRNTHPHTHSCLSALTTGVATAERWHHN